MLEELRKEIISKIIDYNLDVPTIATTLDMSAIYLVSILIIDSNFENWEQTLNLVNEKVDDFIKNGQPELSKQFIKVRI